MLDYKDVPDSRRVHGRRRWTGPLLIVLAGLTLIGGLVFLAVDTLKVQSERKEAQATAVKPAAPEKKPSPRVEPDSEAAEKKAEKPSVKTGVEPKKAVTVREPVMPPAPKKAESAKSEKGGQVAESEKQAEAKPAKPQRKKKPLPEEPHYDFYTLLPEYEVVIPEDELRPKPKAAPPPLEPVEIKAGTAYLIQVGSFRTEQQAEDTRGRLALLGFEASIHEAEAADQKHWYRVRLGPYRDQAELNDVRSLLQAEGFSAFPLKVRIRD